MQNLWAYYPLLFVLFFLVALIIWTYKYAIAVDKCTQEEKAKAETQYNLDKNYHVTELIEASLETLLKTKEFIEELKNQKAVVQYAVGVMN